MIKWVLNFFNEGKGSADLQIRQFGILDRLTRHDFLYQAGHIQRVFELSQFDDLQAAGKIQLLPSARGAVIMIVIVVGEPVEGVEN